MNIMNSILGIAAAILLSLGACANAQTSQPVAKIDSDKQLLLESIDDTTPVAYFAGGCFWCTEASFERINGVKAVISGYAGGTKMNADYKKVSNGSTRHAEAIAIYYNPEIVSYKTLLDVFFIAHDPTTLNYQGPDRGPQYRSAIFYQNENEKQVVQAAIDSVDQVGLYPNKIVTTLEAFDAFYEAEGYHQDYYENNPQNRYIQNVSRPKVEKVEKVFKSILKPAYKKS